MKNGNRFVQHPTCEILLSCYCNELTEHHWQFKTVISVGVGTLMCLINCSVVVYIHFAWHRSNKPINSTLSLSQTRREEISLMPPISGLPNWLLICATPISTMGGVYTRDREAKSILILLQELARLHCPLHMFIAIYIYIYIYIRRYWMKKSQIHL